MLIRSAKADDLNELLQLSAALPPGMTSMPFEKSTWVKKLEAIDESFKESPDPTRERVYFLVMEDLNSGRIVGTAGVVAGVGLTRPFYNYKLSKDFKVSEALDIKVTSNLLNLVNDFTGETELVSLFLLPEFRAKYAGQMLSRCRFLFMSDFPERFSEVVFAEIRGWLDESDKSPFWEHLGRKFFNLPFARADFISAVNGSQFISDLMPRFPVYLELLPEQAVSVLGKPHAKAAPAKRLLEKEGFKYNGTIDIFDAGPVMECRREDIASMRNSRSMELHSLSSAVLSKEEADAFCMVSNCELANYRLTLAPVKLPEGGGIVLSPPVANLIEVEPGDHVRILEIRMSKDDP